MRHALPSLLTAYLFLLSLHNAHAQPEKIFWEQRSVGGGFRTLAVPPAGPIVLAYDEAYRVYDRISGRLIGTYGRTDPWRIFRTRDISTDGRYVLSTRHADTETLTVLRSESGDVLGSRNVASGTSLFTPDGDYVLHLWMGNLTVFAAPSLEQRAQYRSPEAIPDAIAPDSRTFMRIMEGIPVEFDLMTGAEVRRYAGSTNVRQVGYALGGSRIVGFTGTALVVWDAATRERRVMFADRNERLVMRSGGRYAVTMSQTIQGDSTIRVWDIEQQARVRDYRGSGIAFPLLVPTITADERHLAALDANGSLILLDLMSGAVSTLLRAPGVGHSVAADPAGSVVAIGTTTITLHDPSTGQPLRTIGRPGPRYVSLAFSPDGSRVAASAQKRNDGHDHGVVLISVASGEVDTVLPLTYAMDAAFSPDGAIVATCGLDPIVKLWRADGAPLRDLVGHGGWVTTLAFSPDGRHLVTGSHDLTVIVWDVATGSAVRTFFTHSGKVTDVVFTHDGRRVISVADDGRIVELPLDGVPRELERAPTALRTVDLSDDGTLAYVAGVELYGYDLASGRIVERFNDAMRMSMGFYLGAIVPRRGIFATITSDADVIAWRTAATSSIAATRALDDAAPFPNPAGDGISIVNAGGRQSSLSVRIVDPLGRVVLASGPHAVDSGGVLSFDVSSLASGAYWVEQDGDGLVRRHSLLITR